MKNLITRQSDFNETLESLALLLSYSLLHSGLVLVKGAKATTSPGRYYLPDRLVLDQRGGKDFLLTQSGRRNAGSVEIDTVTLMLPRSRSRVVGTVAVDYRSARTAYLSVVTGLVKLAFALLRIGTNNPATTDPVMITQFSGALCNSFCLSGLFNVPDEAADRLASECFVKKTCDILAIPILGLRSNEPFLRN
jgi:hypothetical protein